MSTVRIQVRRGTASQWTSVNPILAAGEMGVESDTNLFKFGNGSSTWSALAYANNSDVAIGEISQDAINTALAMGSGLTKTYNDGANTITINVDSNIVALKSYVDAQITGLSNQSDTTYIPVSDMGMPNGVATLNSNGYVAAEQLDITEQVQDNIASALVAGAGITKEYNDNSNTITFSTNISNGNGIAVSSGVGTERILSIAPSINPTTSITTPLITVDTVLAGTIESTANGSIGGNLTVNGDLVVNGTTTTVNTSNYTVDDPMIYIGEGNNSNLLDLGLVASFNDGTYQHAGLVRDASDGKWKLFSGVIAEPGTTVDFTTYTKDSLELGGLIVDAARIGNVLNTEIQHLSGVTSGIQAQINAKLSEIPLGSVVENTIANEAVTSIKIFPGAVETDKIANLAVTSGKIANLSVTGTKIADGAVSNAKLADTSVTTEKISDSSISTNKIADAAITNSKIAADAVTTINILDEAITSGKILNGTILDVDINNAAGINKGKISGTAVTLADTGTITDEMLAGSISQNKVSDLVQDLAAKAPKDAPTFTGAVVLPVTTSIGTVSATELGYLDGVTSPVQTQLSSLVTADSNHAALTTNVHGIADTAALATKTYVDNAGSALQNNIDTKAPIASPTFTGTVSGITKTMVGLANVDNTSDANKPVSAATQTALDLKAPKDAPTFTGTVTSSNDLVVDGNLTVNGTTFNASSTSIVIEDNMVQLAHQNAANVVDLGLVVAYNDGTAKHSGLVRDVSDAKWKLFQGVTSEPTTTVNFAQGSLDALAVGALEATTVTPSSGVVFSDGTQTKAGIPSITTIGTARGASETLASGEQDKFIPITGAVQITLPATGYSIGQSIDFFQATGTGASFAVTNGVVGTPGLKFRTTYSVVTAMKISSGWLVFGDLSA